MENVPPPPEHPDQTTAGRGGETFIIFERLANGDPRAMDDFFHRYRKWIMELAQSRTGSHILTRIEHDDLTQKVLLDLWNYREMFTPGREAEVRAVAVRIVDNKIRDEARRWNARKRSDRSEVSIGADDAPIDVGSRDPSPSRIATRDEFRGKLEKCLAKLPDDYRRVLVLRVRHQLTLQDAARQLGRSTEATAMLEMRAKKMLRTLMQDEGGTSSIVGG